MGKLKWAERAKWALEKIRNYIAEDSPENALKVVQKLIIASKKLKRFPSIGRFVPELSDNSTRELIILKKYPSQKFRRV